MEIIKRSLKSPVQRNILQSCLNNFFILPINLFARKICTYSFIKILSLLNICESCLNNFRTLLINLFVRDKSFNSPQQPYTRTM